MPTLTARTLFTAIGTVVYPAIEFDSAGIITDVSSDPSIKSEAVLVPSFFDVHVHGGAGFDVMSAEAAGLSAMQRALARRGTGCYLPTTVTASVDATLSALERLAAAVEAKTPENEARPLGIHLEGPFLSHAKRGVHPPELLQQPSVALFERMQQAARGHIRLLTLAPEQPGALELIRHATEAGVRVSLGHSNATFAQTEAALAVGATSATHTFNAMRPLEQREPGILGGVLDSAATYAELICDGIHVAPALVRLWLRLKGERAILVTDGISATEMPDGDYALGPLAVRVAEGRATLVGAPGTLAGSVLTMDRAVANLQAFTGCALEVAARAASSQPAAMLGLSETVASLRVGQPASFNQYGESGRFESAWLFGKPVV